MVPILLTYLVVGLRGSPAEVDWRTKGATTPVRNQGQMGSAIDFSLLEAMATYSAVHTGGTPPMLSSGMLADCAYVCPRVKHTLPISTSQILSVVLFIPQRCALHAGSARVHHQSRRHLRSGNALIRTMEACAWRRTTPRRHNGALVLGSAPTPSRPKGSAWCH